MTFGERLRELRKSLNWTQEHLGEKIGCNKTTVSNYETGYSEPNIETLIKLSEFASVDFLLKGSEIEEKKDTFGSRLRELRKSKHLTAKKLSADLEISPRMVTFLETNDREPNLEMLVKIARLFKVTTDYLLGYEVEK